MKLKPKTCLQLILEDPLWVREFGENLWERGRVCRVLRQERLQEVRGAIGIREIHTVPKQCKSCGRFTEGYFVKRSWNGFRAHSTKPNRINSPKATSFRVVEINFAISEYPLYLPIRRVERNKMKLEVNLLSSSQCMHLCHTANCYRAAMRIDEPLLRFAFSPKTICEIKHPKHTQASTAPSNCPLNIPRSI